MSSILATGLTQAGHSVRHKHFFDTLKVGLNCDLNEVRKRAEQKMINLRYFEDGDVGVSLDEVTRASDVQDLLDVFKCSKKVVSCFVDKC